MHDFFIKELSKTDLETELHLIGFDKSYTHKAKEKFEYKNLKIFNLTPAQANIIKQTALTCGADCGTHREVITGKIDNSCVILGGSISELKKISDKLQYQPFGLKSLGLLIKQKTEIAPPGRTQIIGILNITKNSLSDGGKYYDFEHSIEHLHDLIDEGADIIDIGAESTKPYSKAVSSEEQLEKLLPILEYIKQKNINVPLSIDTRSAVVAQKCIELGADIINDVSGFDYDDRMCDIIAQNPQVKVIIQHSQGTPENMQDAPIYKNLMDEIYINLKNKVDFAISKGIKKENIIVDPGIGFGKTKEHNIQIINRWKELRTIECPVLVGLSRKSFLEMPEVPNEQKDLYTLAFNSILINEKIDYIRVHNVKIHKNFQNILG